MTDQVAAETSAVWYIIHTYSGQEDRVKRNLEMRIESMDVKDKIFQVIVPTEDEVEIKGGERKHVQRKIFPGYILLEMIMTDNAWHVVKNTPKVTGFVGAGMKPTPLDREEVDHILHQVTVAAEKPKPVEAEQPRGGRGRVRRRVRCRPV